jgi:hypothetical protein
MATPSPIHSFTVDDLAAATFVPYNDDGSVNFAGVDGHCKDLADHKVLTAFSAWPAAERVVRL